MDIKLQKEKFFGIKIWQNLIPFAKCKKYSLSLNECLAFGNFIYYKNRETVKDLNPLKFWSANCEWEFHVFVL